MARVHARAYICGADLTPEEAKEKLLGTNPGFLVQTMRAESVKNEFVVEMLAAQTFQAQASGSLLAKKPEIDLLLRVAGTTQISSAIKKHGARARERFLAVVAGDSAVQSPRAFSPLELPRNSLNRSELARVECAALLNTLKG